MINYILCLLVFISFISCSSISEVRYEKAYQIISKDFINKDTSISMFGNDISGVLIYDSIYANPIRDNNYYGSILSEKSDERTPVLRKDKILSRISRNNINPNWDLHYDFNLVWGSIVQHDRDNINAPLSVALFSEIDNNQLRIDVVPFFIGYPKYCGSIYKYYFKYKQTQIIQYKKWVDNYECW